MDLVGSALKFEFEANNELVNVSGREDTFIQPFPDVWAGRNEIVDHLSATIFQIFNLESQTKSDEVSTTEFFQAVLFCFSNCVRRLVKDEAHYFLQVI
ncbi:hypothetical protein GGTG_13551 [Gaeumannomyces tritici R3-111a-1]|uniref:Uncharacterized protein n=1 Tax=Gaeumannomyces tritici (strain R3-111a-1) TaxID=644352 RepID=J3PJ69_GAET3|nr:hypothetical protein GGTG_13551 [Gaeumannomyces tritici R3-111a-1]EJT68887.1 hypothetical protein GGTG_13551 [Gaeumannomyces tritici R3-111a-1]